MKDNMDFIKTFDVMSQYFVKVTKMSKYLIVTDFLVTLRKLRIESKKESTV